MENMRRDREHFGAVAALRLQLVPVIERIAPFRFCHAALIGWAICGGGFPHGGGRACRQDSARQHDSGCYCGYYWNGRLNRK